MFLIIFFYGLIFGSFCNACIYRFHKNETLITRSHCTRCMHALSPFDLVPVFSYIFLKGRCRYCNTKISIWYPIMEFVSGLIWVLFFYSFGFTHLMFIFCGIFFIVSFLFGICNIDENFIVKNKSAKYD